MKNKCLIYIIIGYIIALIDSVTMGIFYLNADDDSLRKELDDHVKNNATLDSSWMDIILKGTFGILKPLLWPITLISWIIGAVKFLKFKLKK